MSKSDDSARGEEFAEELKKRANAVADAYDCDVLFYSGPILGSHDDRVIAATRGGERRSNVLLMLCTLGGEPDAAFRIARCLQRSYDRVSIYIHGYCKSAGTLICLGADELVMSDFAELGPLDVQLRHNEEIGERSSGLTPVQSLSTLRDQSYEHFLRSLLAMRQDLNLPTKLAAQLATELAVGVFRGIYEQIDPMRLGEIDRAVRIAVEYGDRLGQQSGNLRPDTISRLVTDYPSHGFVIDREEASELFHHVRQPQADEELLASHVENVLRSPPNGSEPIVMMLSSQPPIADISEDPADGERSDTRSAPNSVPSGGSKDGRNDDGDGQEFEAGAQQNGAVVENDAVDARAASDV